MTNKSIGLIGYGLAGSAFHAPLIASTPGLDLSVIVTSDAKRAAAATALYPDVRIAANIEQLWEDAPDAVVVATPNASHAPIAGDAISRGIAVVIDKPMALSSGEAGALIYEAKIQGVPLTVFQNRRWDGDFLTVSDLVKSGELGAISRFESRFERWRPEVSKRWREQSSPAEGGGLLFDLGAHLLDQAVALFGIVASVYAEVDTTRAGSQTDDDVFIALTHESGTRSHLWMSATAADPGPRFRVLGTAGAYTSYGLDVQEGALRAGELPGPGWGEVPEANWGTLHGGDAPVAHPTVPGNYPAFYQEFAECLINGGPVPVNPAEAVSTLRLIEAARISSEAKSVVDMDW